MDPTYIWVLLALYILSRRHLGKRASGKLTLAPSEGTVRVPTKFHPHEVELKFIGSNPVPGCSQLEDSAVVESIDAHGFTIRYSIQSGVRVLRWRASA
jgi:hypothetical protein